MEELMQGPIAGEGLTQDPENPAPWETAPEYTKIEDFMDDLFLNLTQEDNIDGVLDALRKEIPAEDVAQMLLFQAMSSGKITPDLVLGGLEPTIYMLIGLGEYAGIDVVLYPEDDMIDSDGFEEDAKFEEIPTPKGISKSLVDKIKEGK